MLAGKRSPSLAKGLQLVSPIVTEQKMRGNSQFAPRRQIRSPEIKFREDRISFKEAKSEGSGKIECERIVIHQMV